MATSANEARLLAAIEEAEITARRSRPLLLLGLALLIAAFVSLSIYLNNARNAAERVRDQAVAEALEKSSAANAAANTLEAALVALQAQDRETAVELIRHALNRLEKVAGSPLPEGAAKVARDSTPVQAAQPQVTSVLQEAAAERPGISLPAYPAGSAYEVYIQFAGGIARGEVVDLNHALRESGWNVQGPSGERIATAAGLNEVRYSRDADAEAAQALASALTQAGIAGRRVQARQLAIIEPDTLEVWISN